MSEHQYVSGPFMENCIISELHSTLLILSFYAKNYKNESILMGNNLSKELTVKCHFIRCVHFRVVSCLEDIDHYTPIMAESTH